MKKLLTFVSMCLIFASCTKDRTCTCVDQPNGGPSTTYVVTLKNVSNATAKNACISTQDKDSNGNITDTKTCTLK